MNSRYQVIGGPDWLLYPLGYIDVLSFWGYKLYSLYKFFIKEESIKTKPFVLVSYKALNYIPTLSLNNWYGITKALLVVYVLRLTCWRLKTTSPRWEPYFRAISFPTPMPSHLCLSHWYHLIYSWLQFLEVEGFCE